MELTREHDMELTKVACEGNLEQVKDFIKKNGVQVADSNGYTLAHWAAYTGNVDLLKVLKEQGADFNTENRFGQQAIHLAAKENNIQAVAYLKEQGVNINAQDKEGLTPLHSATYKGQVEMIQWLCENGADVNILNMRKQSPAYYAVINGNIAAMETLVKNGDDVNARDDSNKSLAHYAVQYGQLDMLKWLKNNGADMKAVVGYDQESLLHTAASAEKDDWKMVDFLVNECGLSINAGNKFGITPLMKAAGKGNDVAAKKLLDLGANVNVGEKTGWSALMFAANTGNNKVVEILLNYGADPNIGDKSGWTPGHHAADNGREETLKILYKNKANLDQRADWEGFLNPGPSAKMIYERRTGKKLPTVQWEKEIQNEAKVKAPQTNAQSNGNMTNVLEGKGQNISNAVAVAEVPQSDTSRSANS